MPCANPCAGTRSAPGKKRTAPIPIKLYVWVYGIYKIFHPYFHALRYYIGFLGFPLRSSYNRDGKLAVSFIIVSSYAMPAIYQAFPRNIVLIIPDKSMQNKRYFSSSNI